VSAGALRPRRERRSSSSVRCCCCCQDVYSSCSSSSRRKRRRLQSVCLQVRSAQPGLNKVKNQETRRILYLLHRPADPRCDPKDVCTGIVGSSRCLFLAVALDPAQDRSSLSSIQASGGRRARRRTLWLSWQILVISRASPPSSAVPDYCQVPSDEVVFPLSGGPDTTGQLGRDRRGSSECPPQVHDNLWQLSLRNKLKTLRRWASTSGRLLTVLRWICGSTAPAPLHPGSVGLLTLLRFSARRQRRSAKVRDVKNSCLLHLAQSNSWTDSDGRLQGVCWRNVV